MTLPGCRHPPRVDGYWRAMRSGMRVAIGTDRASGSASNPIAQILGFSRRWVIWAPFPEADLRAESASRAGSANRAGQGSMMDRRGHHMRSWRMP
jgi:hypothetical protein